MEPFLEYNVSFLCSLSDSLIQQILEHLQYARYYFIFWGYSSEQNRHRLRSSSCSDTKDRESIKGAREHLIADRGAYYGENYSRFRVQRVMAALFGIR